MPYPDDDLLPEEFPNGVPEGMIEEAYPDSDADAYAEDAVYDDGYDDSDPERPPLPVDPIVVYVMLILIAILGAGSLRTDVRYTILWTVLTVVGVASLIMDEMPVERATMRDLLLGLAYGGMIGLPILAVTSGQLRMVSNAVFGQLPPAAVFQTVAFTMPLAETLFFRMVFQNTRGLLLTTAAASLWTILLLFPALNVLEFPLVAAVLAVSMLFINFVYSYLRQRFSIFAAWTCQIAINVSLLFLSRFAG